MTYQELEQLQQLHKGKVCIWGAGMIGRTWAYDILTATGFIVDSYYDRNLNGGITVRDGIKTINWTELAEDKESILVFVAVNEKLQGTIIQQLEQMGITNYVLMGYLFLQEFCESVLKENDLVLKEKYKDIVDDEIYLTRLFRYKLGYDLDLQSPQTFNEKIQWLKLNDRNPQYVDWVDKYEFKKRVERMAGENYIIPTLGIWDRVEEIEWDKLPQQFVIKCTHDSGSTIICKDKDQFDVNEAIRKLEYGLKRNFYWIGREWPYKHVKPRILAEKYMEDSVGELVDYKFLCYDGVFRYAFTCTERFSKSGLKVTFFDREWNRLAIKRHYENSQRKIAKPKNYQKMIELAEKISSGYPFVRVDFYEINGRIYLGEFTLYPGCGFEEFENYEEDLLLGKYITCGD